MWPVIKNFLRQHLLDIVLVLALALSCVSYYRTCTNSARIDDLTVQISDVQKSVVELQKQLFDRLDYMQAQLDFISKYAEANYYHFYGDVDGRHAKITNQTKSTSKTTNK